MGFNIRNISQPRVSQYGSANYDFSFVDDYIQQSTRANKPNPNQVIEDNDGFYNEEDSEVDIETVADEEIINSPESEQQEESFMEQEMSEYIMGSENPALDYMLEYDDAVGDQPVQLAQGQGIAETHNNPGNLKYSPWMEKYGAKPGKPGQDGGQFAFFPDINAGMAARKELLQKPLYANKTVHEAMKLYSNKGYDGSIYPEISNKKMSDLTPQEREELTRRQVVREDRTYATKLGYVKQAGGATLPTDSNFVGRMGPLVRDSDIPGSVDIYLPEDVEGVVKLVDKRKINPVTGKPFKKTGTKTLDAPEAVVRSIITHAKAQGVDPYTAIAIGLQESNLGDEFINFGFVNSQSVQDKIKTLNLSSGYDEQAAKLVLALKEKMDYGKDLVDRKKIPNKEEFILQAYNGYGKLFPTTVSKFRGYDASAFYEYPVSKKNPLDMMKNPAYGKTVIQLRDEVIKKNKDIEKWIRTTEPFVYPTQKATGGIAITPEQQYVGLNNPAFDYLMMPLMGWNTIRGLDSGEPVAVEDDFGNSEVLHGPKDTTILKGTVREKRLRKRK